MSGKAKPINYKSAASSMNAMLKDFRGKEVGREQLRKVISACIPIPSKVDPIIAEMCKDGCIKKTGGSKHVRYVLMDYPILYTRIEKWVTTIRTRDHINSTITPDKITAYLEKLSTTEFVKLIKPICKDHQCKLYVADGYDESAIKQLPQDILDQITLYKMA